MRITPFNIRLTIVVLFLRIFLKGISMYGIDSFLLKFNLFNEFEHFISIAYGSMDIFLFVFFYSFLNTFLNFKKVNLLIIIFIIINTAYLPYNIYRINKIGFEQWEHISLLITTVVFFTTNLIYCFKLFRYNSLLRKEINYYAISQIAGISVQATFPFIASFLFIEDFNSLKIFSEYISLLPYFTLIVLYYKAIKYTNEANEIESNILDSEEYSV